MNRCLWNLKPTVNSPGFWQPPKKMTIIYQLMIAIIIESFKIVGEFEVSLLNCFGFLPQDFNDSSIAQARNTKPWGICRLINIESAICQLTKLNPPIHPTKKSQLGLVPLPFPLPKMQQQHGGSSMRTLHSSRECRQLPCCPCRSWWLNSW